MATPDRKRLARLQRLEKVRAIARQTAATAAAEAEGTLAQLLELAERTGRLADDYALRRDSADGGGLRQLASFREGLAQVSQGTTADALRARRFADDKLHELAVAERRRQAVEDRAEAEQRALDGRRENPPLTARRSLGTGLE